MLRASTCAFLLLFATSAGAATFRVNSTADSVDATPGDGTCATSVGSCTLRAAIQEANALAGGDRIRVPAGVYELTRAGAGEDDAATGDLDVRGRLRVIGAGADSTIVDGNALDRVFDVGAGARVTLTKLAVRGGDAASDSGGGVNARIASRLVVKRMLVEGNEAFAGGGIAANGRLVMATSTVRGNTASVGGGVAMLGGSTIRTSTFDDNTATGFGAFSGHDVVAQRAGILEIANSTITGQVQVMAFCQGTPPARTCFDGADVVLANVTVNEVSHVVQALDQDDLHEGGFTLRNTILFSCASELNSQGFNFIVPEGCTILGDLSGVIIGDSPLLGSLRDNGGPTFTRLPNAISDAVEGGNPATPGSGGASCEPTDQRGVPRDPTVTGRCDIGAVER